MAQTARSAAPETPVDRAFEEEQLEHHDIYLITQYIHNHTKLAVVENPPPFC
jgi:hypothetical protein